MALALQARNVLSGSPQFPQNVTTGCCPQGQKCLGEIFSTIVGCLCLGVCVPEDFSIGNGPLVPWPENGGNGGPFPPAPPPPAPPPPPPPAPPPQAAPQLGTCAPRAGAVPSVLCPAGCHPNKSDYFLRSGTFVAKGTRCVRNRRRNPLNPRALDRAASRLRSAKRVGRFLAGVKIPKKCR